MKKLTREVRVRAINEKIIDLYECAHEAEEYEGYSRAELEEEYYSRIRKLEDLLQRLKSPNFIFEEVWLGVWQNSCVFNSETKEV